MYNTALRPAPELTEKYFPSSPKLWIDISIANLMSFRKLHNHLCWFCPYIFVGVFRGLSRNYSA